MRERLVWADAARALACGLVVLVHVNFYTRAGLETWWPFGFTGAPLFTLAVPTFMALAGFFAERTGAGDDVLRGASGRTAFRLVLPFLAWNLLTLAALAADGLRVDAGTAVFRALTGTWQMYFIFALLQLLVLHRLLGRRAATGLALAFATGTSAAVYGLSDLILWTRGADDGSLFGMFAEHSLPCWAVFYFLGAWLARHPAAFEHLARRNGTVAVLVAASYGACLAELRLEEHRFGYDPLIQLLFAGFPLQVLGSVLALALLRELDLSGRARGLLARLASAGPDTFGIYLSHVAVLVGVFAAARTVGLTTARWFETPLLAITTWVLSRGLVRLTRRLAPGWLAFVVFGEASARAAPPRLQLSSSVTTRFATNAPE